MPKTDKANNVYVVTTRICEKWENPVVDIIGCFNSEELARKGFENWNKGYKERTGREWNDGADIQIFPLNKELDDLGCPEYIKLQ